MLVLNAAVVDPTPVKGKGGVNRNFVVNYLANVVFVRECRKLGVLGGSNSDGTTPRVIVISSGAYAEGSTNFFGAFDDYSILQGIKMYYPT